MKSCYRFHLILLVIFPLLTSFAQVPPKREFRGAWIATVVNLDWPSTQGGDPQAQRSQLTLILDGLKAVGINAVVFQIRPECDALYPSTIEPWSYWLTGAQGVAPSAPFDPLQFAIDEAHKRGMELHAWFNPYRAERSVENYALADSHVVKKHPEWILTFGTLKMLDPGLPAARDHVLSVILDVVRRYDVDGIHWDDYFYPYSGIINQDSASWWLHNRGFTNIADWRRDNVNLLVKTVSDSVKNVKPRVKFGISPFGIWKSGYPPGIVGTSAYDDLYCDALTWLNSKWIDYITPQLYWRFGGGQDYGLLMPWWAQQASVAGRHFYPGQAAYRITDSNWGASELPNQMRLNRSNSLAQGSIFFRANYGVIDNPKGFADSLRNNFYRYPALKPLMSFKETTPPNAPTALNITPSQTTARLTWTAPSAASDGEAASYHVVYRSSLRPIDISDARNILSIQQETSYTETNLPSAGVTYYYAVAALDKLQNESALSNLVGIDASGVVGIEEQPTVIASFRLFQNYPNPFNPSTIISFNIPTEQNVTLRVYDLLGREVKVLVDGVLGSGEHQYQFDGTGLATGVYIYRLIAGSSVESKKMQLLR
jgi:uncharacterized lipoprotein YddW (UPF0748 family)